MFEHFPSSDLERKTAKCFIMPLLKYRNYATTDLRMRGVKHFAPPIAVFSALWSCSEFTKTCNSCPNWTLLSASADEKIVFVNDHDRDGQ